MYKKLTFRSLMLLMLLSPISCSSGIPETAGTWRVEVGPPGNEFYQEPAVVTEQAPPPSQEMFDTVKLIAPDYTQTKRWVYQNNEGYFIRAEAESEEYDFMLSRNGNLISLDYEDDRTNIQETAGEAILVGTLKSGTIKDIPEKTMTTLGVLFPAKPPREVWNAETPAGPRIVIALEGMAFYARPDGQIQAFGRIEEGALNEVEPLVPKTPEQVAQEAEEKLGPYRDRFNFDDRIKKLVAASKDEYRFIVVGDSRSNKDLWTNIVKHIDQLDPKPDFVINTGDIVRHGYTEEYLDYYIPPLLETDIPHFVALGNHDDGDDAMAGEYRALLGENSLNYFFDFGGKRFIFIDNTTKVTPYKETLRWLEQALEGTPANHSIIVAAHKPVYVVEKWAYHSWDRENSRLFADLMTKHKVEHVFFGHIHAYSTAEFEGVPYTISGGGGAGLHNRYGPLGNVHHYLVCDVASDGTITQQVVRFYPESK